MELVFEDDVRLATNLNLTVYLFDDSVYDRFSLEACNPQRIQKLDALFGAALIEAVLEPLHEEIYCLTVASPRIAKVLHQLVEVYPWDGPIGRNITTKPVYEDLHDCGAGQVV